jgi:nanoRNase/pAp phosphatase (c-di-AMP/oligoRNAs hydrolase)
LDKTAVLWLTERADPALLAEIESAPLSRDYFDDLAMALFGSTVFGDAVYCLLPQAEGAEIVGEVADLLVRCRSICRVFCGALVGGDLVVSVRTERPEDNAAKLVQKVLVGLGSGGGHRHRAGGKIPDVAGATITDALNANLRRRWLSACGIANTSGTPFITGTEIRGHILRKEGNEPGRDPT